MQVETSKKIAELENLRKVLDEKRTPKGQGTDGSRFNSAKEELKAQLSSIKASLAASQDGHESTEDTGAMQTKVRSQLDKLYQNEDDTQVLSYTFVCLTACGLGFCWTNMNNLVWSCE